MAYSKQLSLRMTEIHIIGTFHLDPEGRNRLKILLHEINPDVIAIEMSQSVDSRTLNGEELEWITQKVIEIIHPKEVSFRDFILKFIGFIKNLIGYEYGISQKYSKENNIQLVNVDMDIFSLKEDKRKHVMKIGFPDPNICRSKTRLF